APEQRPANRAVAFFVDALPSLRCAILHGVMARARRAAPRVAMRLTAIRMGDDLWRLFEGEAARVGVSVSQYIREAALSRAAAAAALRGEDPHTVLAQAALSADASEPADPPSHEP